MRENLGTLYFGNVPMPEAATIIDDVSREARMTDIDREITAYDKIRGDLEAHHMGEWVVMREEQVIGVYVSFDLASADAVARFGRGPYLIRQIGAPPVTLSASVIYNVSHG